MINWYCSHITSLIILSYFVMTNTSTITSRKWLIDWYCSHITFLIILSSFVLTNRSRNKRLIDIGIDIRQHMANSFHTDKEVLGVGISCCLINLSSVTLSWVIFMSKIRAAFLWSCTIALFIWESLCCTALWRWISGHLCQNPFCFIEELVSGCCITLNSNWFIGLLVHWLNVKCHFWRSVPPELLR